MNNRIKELARDYLITSEYTECGSQECYKYEFHPEELEEFTKSIIQEVMSEVYDEIQYNFSSGYAKEITDDVKQRFGVE